AFSLRLRQWVGLRIGSDFDLPPRRVEPLLADLQIGARFVNRLQRSVQRQVAVFELAQLLVEQLQGSLVRELLQRLRHPASSTNARKDPRASRTSTRLPRPVSPGALITAPLPESIVML